MIGMDEDEWPRVLKANLSGAFHMCQAVLDHMIDCGTGRIVNVSSVVGQQGERGTGQLRRPEIGLFGLTRTLAQEAAYGSASRPTGRPAALHSLEKGGIGLR